MLENLPPFHPGVSPPFLQVLVGDPGVFARGTDVTPESLRKPPVSVKVGGEDPPSLPIEGPEDRSARTVPEEDRHVPSLGGEIQTRGLDLHPHQKDRPVLARAYPGIGDGEAVNETGALGPHVQRRHPGKPKLCLEESAGSWKGVIRAQRGQDDSIDIGSLQTCGIESHVRRPPSHFGTSKSFLFRNPTSLQDPRSFPDPFVGRVHPEGKVAVCDNTVGYVEARSEEDGVDHGSSLS